MEGLLSVVTKHFVCKKRFNQVSAFTLNSALKCLHFLSNININTANALISVLIGKFINPLSANPTKWANTLKQFVSKLLMNCVSVFDHFVGLALKGLRSLTCSIPSTSKVNDAHLHCKVTFIICEFYLLRYRK